MSSAEASSAEQSCQDFQGPPGTKWAGMKCINCQVKLKDHWQPPVETRPTSASLESKSASWVKTEQSKPKPPTNGTQQGSLAFFMGKQLGAKHSGSSTGLVRTVHNDGADRAYHASQKAQRQQAATALGNAFMSGARSPEGKLLRPSELAAQRQRHSIS